MNSRANTQRNNVNPRESGRGSAQIGIGRNTKRNSKARGIHRLIEEDRRVFAGFDRRATPKTAYFNVITIYTTSPHQRYRERCTKTLETYGEGQRTLMSTVERFIVSLVGSLALSARPNRRTGRKIPAGIRRGPVSIVRPRYGETLPNHRRF